MQYNDNNIATQKNYANRDELLYCPLIGFTVGEMVTDYVAYARKQHGKKPDICSAQCMQCENVKTFTEEYDTLASRIKWKIRNYFSLALFFMIPFCIAMYILNTHWVVGIIPALIVPIFFEIVHFHPTTFEDWLQEIYEEDFDRNEGKYNERTE